MTPSIIGRLVYDGDPRRYFNGKIDEVQIYPRALSAAQVLQLCNNGDSDGDCRDGIDVGQGVGGPSLITPYETNTGEVWDLTVFPLHDSGGVGTSMEAQNVSGITITAYDPLISVTLPAGPLTADDDITSVLDPTVAALQALDTTGIYTWTVDPDGAAPVENLMALSMPFNYGSTIEDFSNENNDGTVIGDPLYIDPTNETAGVCQVGGCMSFYGSGGGVSIPDSASLRPSEGTISAWFNSAITIDSGENYYYSVVNRYTDASNGTIIQTMANDGRMRFWHNGNIIYSNSSSWTADTWYHIAVTFGQDGMKMYVNGALQADTDTYSSGVTTTNPFQIGRSEAGNWYWNGQIDEVQMYSRSLSAVEIVQLCDDGDGDSANGTCDVPTGGALGAGVGGPTVIVDEETLPGETWDLTVTPISYSGLTGPSESDSVYIEGLTISGTCKDDVGGANCANGTKVDVAVNGSVPGTTTLSSGDGTWSISDIAVISGQAITVFIDNVLTDDSDRSVGVSKYSGSGDPGGFELIRGYLTVGATGSDSVTNADIGHYDDALDAGDDVFIEVDDVTDALTTNNNVYVLSGSTYAPGADVIMTGTNWDNNGTVSFTTGEAEFTNAGTVQIDGVNTWYDFTTSTAGQRLEFEANVIQNIASGGVFAVTGTYGNEIGIASDSAGTQWRINHQGTEDVQFAGVEDSGCTSVGGGDPQNTTSVRVINGIVVDEPTSNGTCWLFSGLTLNGGVETALTSQNITSTATGSMPERSWRMGGNMIRMG